MVETVEAAPRGFTGLVSTTTVAAPTGGTLAGAGDSAFGAATLGGYDGKTAPRSGRT